MSPQKDKDDSVGLFELFSQVRVKREQMRGIIDGLESLHLFKQSLVDISEKIDEIHKATAEMVEDQQGGKRTVIVKCPKCNSELKVTL